MNKAIKKSESFYNVQLRSSTPGASKEWFTPIEALKVSFAFASGFAMASKMLNPRPAIKIIQSKTLQEVLFIPGEVEAPDRSSFRGSPVLKKALLAANPILKAGLKC